VPSLARYVYAASAGEEYHSDVFITDRNISWGILEILRGGANIHFFAQVHEISTLPV
jgi:hypothetical protein